MSTSDDVPDDVPVKRVQTKPVFYVKEIELKEEEPTILSSLVKKLDLTVQNYVPIQDNFMAMLIPNTMFINFLPIYDFCMKYGILEGYLMVTVLFINHAKYGDGLKSRFSSMFAAVVMLELAGILICYATRMLFFVTGF